MLWMGTKARLCAGLFAMGLAACSAGAQKAASTPPMGWNSWDAYGLTITEAQFRENVTVLKAKLLPFGWNYAVIDEGWFMRNPQDRPHPELLVHQVDAHGRYVPVPERFPSSEPGSMGPAAVAGEHIVIDRDNKGFTELGRWVHAQGLKFGIHIVRGIPRESVTQALPIEGAAFTTADAADTTDACPWDPTNWGVKDNAAGQAWYDALLRQYAGWGVDFLKVDCISDHPYKVSEIRQIRRAIDKAGRPMVLSLSPGPTNPSHADEVAALSTMWRISDDFWDTWAGMPGKAFPQSLTGQFDRLKQWAEIKLPAGRWPDADMLPFGELKPSPGWQSPRHTRLTPDEQQTVMTLWAMNQSPLILGANLTMLDEATLKLLTNRDVLAIDQQATSHREVVRKDDLVVWRAELAGGRAAVAIFNRGDAPMAMDSALSAIGPGAGIDKLQRKDIWTGARLGKLSRIPPHGVVLLEIH